MNKPKEKEKPEDQRRFDDALKRVWNAPPQPNTAKKKEQKKK